MNASDKRDADRAAAIQRLAASRLRLRRQLLPHADADAGGPQKPFSIPRRLRALWRTLRRGLHGSPVATVALTALQEWWQGHPWRATGELVAEELHATLTPVVRRHPVAAMVLSGAIGLAIVKGKPWRWPFVHRHLQPLPGRITRWLFDQLGAAPGQALLSALLVMLARQSHARADEAPPDKT